jgi:hypothetical protein
MELKSTRLLTNNVEIQSLNSWAEGSMAVQLIGNYSDCWEFCTWVESALYNLIKEKKAFSSYFSSFLFI